MDDEQVPAIFCDAVQSLGVHNGTVRLSLVRLGATGQPIPAVELQFPAGQVPELIRALQKVRV